MSEQLAQFKEAQRTTWGNAAETWQREYAKFATMTRQVTDLLVREARVASGMRVLDLAGGTGEPSLTIAKIVGEGGSVVMSDFVPAMVEAARSNAAEAGLRNMTFEQVDAEEIPFPEASFDAVTCRWGVMLFPDVAKALGEVRRVLKPGGRATFVAWCGPEHNPFFSEPNSVLAAHGLVQQPPPGAPTVFRFAAEGSLREAMAAAGFGEADERSEEVELAWPGRAEESYAFFKDGSPWRAAIEAIPEERREAIEEEILSKLRPRYDGTATRFPARVVVASGVK